MTFRAVSSRALSDISEIGKSLTSQPSWEKAMGRAIYNADTGGKAPPPARQHTLTLPNGTVVAYDEFKVKAHGDGSVTITMPQGEVTTPVNPDSGPDGPGGRD
jgi:hypothetical protein